ncbi:hypothetical protein H9W90_13370 [Polaribacter pectinis]|uniref:Uncharacterized protein n=2 Tax=Polaribacter pectinis TaxID=2738844 RepID=A0A7G9LES8_9FLAO|nr:hypothetical protein H9W90_13370 [Polaribacter pectinis]
MLKPIAPFVEYAIDYDYISKVLCINKDKPEMSCNGKCQLMQKLEQQKKDDFKSLRIHMEEYPIGFVKILGIANKNIVCNSKIALFRYTKNYNFLYSKDVFHPPNS